MGLLRNFDLQKLQTECFVETGTQQGLGLDYALQHDFKELHSIEINEEYYNFCTQKYKHVDRAKLWLGSSEEKMHEILSAIKDYKSCFFWLDAHLPDDPGSQLGDTYARSNDDIEFPLEKELRLIKQSRDTAHDIILYLLVSLKS